MTTPTPASEIAEAILNGEAKIETTFGTKNLVGLSNMILQTVPLSILERAEAFVSVFEEDSFFEDVAELLSDLRAVISQHKQ